MSNYVGPSAELMEHAQRLWGTKGVYRLIRGNENWVYALEGTELIFRFTANYHRTKNELEGELEFIQFLRHKKCPVVLPIPSQTKELVHALDDVWCVVVFQKAEGRMITEELHFNSQMAENWGRALATMNMHAQNYVPQSVKRRSWSDDDGCELARSMIAVIGKDHFVSQIFLDCESQIQKLPTDPSVYGLIHADLHHGNFFVNEANELAVFDFDDACYHWYLFDLAIPIAHIELSVLLKRYSGDIRKYKKDVIRGYSNVRPLPAFAESQIELFVRYRMAHLYLWGASRIHLQRTNDIVLIEAMKTECENYLKS